MGHQRATKYLMNTMITLTIETINTKEKGKMMKLNYDQVQDWIKEAGYECGKNTAMVDVFFRFANIVLERGKLSEPKPAPKPEVKIEKAAASSSPVSAPSPLPSTSPGSQNPKQITIG